MPSITTEEALLKLQNMPGKRAQSIAIVLEETPDDLSDKIVARFKANNFSPKDMIEAKAVILFSEILSSIPANGTSFDEFIFRINETNAFLNQIWTTLAVERSKEFGQ